MDLEPPAAREMPCPPDSRDEAPCDPPVAGTFITQNLGTGQVRENAQTPCDANDGSGALWHGSCGSQIGVSEEYRAGDATGARVRANWSWAPTENHSIDHAKAQEGLDDARGLEDALFCDKCHWAAPMGLALAMALVVLGWRSGGFLTGILAAVDPLLVEILGPHNGILEILQSLLAQLVLESAPQRVDIVL
jgi:hypothetical protein